MSFSNMRMHEFLSALASPTPTPGGGTAAAIAGAMGTALLMMVAGLEKTKSNTDDDPPKNAPLQGLSIAYEAEEVRIFSGLSGEGVLSGAVRKFSLLTRVSECPRVSPFRRIVEVRSRLSVRGTGEGQPKASRRLLERPCRSLQQRAAVARVRQAAGRRPLPKGLMAPSRRTLHEDEDGEPLDKLRPSSITSFLAGARAGT